ncbi:MAG: hypothetical protein WC756_06715 [Taibaiella sp.]
MDQFIKCTLKMVVNKLTVNLKATIIIILIEVILSCFSCRVKSEERTEVNTVQIFLKKASQKDTSSLFEMLSPELNGRDVEGTLSKIRQINILSEKYSLSKPDKWIIEYDTSGTIVKYKNIIVPFSASGIDTSVIAKASFSFDYTHRYLPVNIISVFYVDISTEIPSTDFIDTTQSMIELK